MRRAALSLLASACAWSVAQAAPFADPTRPPAVAEASSTAAVSTGGARLESVLIAPDRRLAVINGQQVGVGGKVADSEVVRISETEVVIRTAEGLQTLKLVPEFKRTPAPPERSTSP